MEFINADCEKIAVENPVGIMNRYYKKADQYIEPLWFGHPASKRTGLWLKNLPKLEPTQIVEQEFHISKTGRKWDKWFWDSSIIPDLSEGIFIGGRNGKDRSERLRDKDKEADTEGMLQADGL